MKHFVMHVIGLIIAGCIVATPSIAQNKPFGQKGTVELSGSFSFTNTSVSIEDKTDVVGSHSILIINLAPEIGYFISDGVEIGFNPGVIFAGSSYGSGITGSVYSNRNAAFMQLFAFLGYNIRSASGNTTPFFEIPFGFTGAFVEHGSPATGFSWGLKGGLKIGVGGPLLLTTYAEYFHLTFNNSYWHVLEKYDVISLGVAFGGYF